MGPEHLTRAGLRFWGLGAVGRRAVWLQARRRPAEGILHPLLFAELMPSPWMLPGQSCLQVWWHLSDRTPQQGPCSRAQAACAGDVSCSTVKLRLVPCWEPVRGEKVLGAALLAPGCARARLDPRERQLLQRQRGCCTARSRWDHTPRFPSANLAIESSPLCQYLPSVRDKVATKVIGAGISICPG